MAIPNDLLHEEKHNKKLLVEGKDDQHVILALREKFNISENFDVIDCGGIENLMKTIPLRIKESGVNTIGIIVDADIEIKNRWDSLSSLLVSLGFKCPAEIPGAGLITKHNEIQIGIWIMPDNNLNGMLEDFISFLIPSGDLLQTTAIETLYAIEEKEINGYNIIHRPKALIHTWLSWQEAPGTPMGLAITKKYLSTEGEQCGLFIEWLKNMFI